MEYLFFEGVFTNNYYNLEATPKKNDSPQVVWNNPNKPKHPSIRRKFPPLPTLLNAEVLPYQLLSSQSIILNKSQDSQATSHNIPVDDATEIPPRFVRLQHLILKRKNPYAFTGGS